MMDCLTAQAIISEALDQQAHAEEVLAAAKQHCRDCPECASFVRTLLVVSRSPLPEPPADLADRIMARIAADRPAARVADPAAQGTAALADGVYSTGVPAHADAEEPALPAAFGDLMTGSSRQRPPLTPLQRLFRPESRRATVSWLSAAAVTLIVAGWGAIAGVRQMLIPPPITEYSVRSAAESAPLQDDAARSLGGLGTQPGGTALGGSGTATATVEPRMVVLEGDAYRYAGPAPEETDRAALKSAGRIVTALDTGASARSYTAYRGDAPEQIFIDRQGELHRFERIWLTYEGSMYKLKSGPITSFGEWPTWPSPATKPRTESGAPSMREAGEADGTKVFVPTSGEAGIALPPQPAAPSALAGCPEWTWWEPTTPF